MWLLGGMVTKTEYEIVSLRSTDYISEGPGVLYIPSPLRVLYIPKKAKGEFRRVYACTNINDIEFQRRYLNKILDKSISPHLSPNSYAYRKNMSYKDAVIKLEELAKAGFNWATHIDVHKFFDSIDRNKLYSELEDILDVETLNQVKLFLETPYWSDKKLCRNRTGICQGLPISPILSNLYLTILDLELLDHKHIQLVRYCDDILVLATSHEWLKKGISIVKRNLRNLGLKYIVKDHLDLRRNDIVFLGLSIGIRKNALTVTASRRSQTKLLDFINRESSPSKVYKSLPGMLRYYTMDFRYLNFYWISKELVSKTKGGEFWNTFCVDNSIPLY